MTGEDLHLVPVCECCDIRPALVLVQLSDGQVARCGTCLDDAQTLGLLSGGAA